METKSKKIPILAKLFQQNIKFKFDITVHENIITFRNHPSVVFAIFLMFVRPLDLFIKQSGKITIIYDPDTLLNKQWLRIWR